MLLFYEVTKLNTFADGFIKCEKRPLEANNFRKEKGETQAHQHGIIYLHKHVLLAVMD